MSNSINLANNIKMKYYLILKDDEHFIYQKSTERGVKDRKRGLRDSKKGLKDTLHIVNLALNPSIFYELSSTVRSNS